MLLEMHVVDLGHASLVSGRGEVDLSSSPLLRERVLAAAIGNVYPNIIVDLREVTYIDGSGLRVLEECRKVCHQNGQRIVIIAPKLIRRLIEIVGLEEHLKLADTPEAALRLLPRAD